MFFFNYNYYFDLKTTSKSDFNLKRTNMKDYSTKNIIRGKIISIREFESFALVCVKAGENFISRISLAAVRKLGLNVGDEIFLMIKSNSIKVLNG